MKSNLNFTNKNAESFFRWFFRRNEKLEHVVFYFLSRTNSTSYRYFSLFEASTKIRIVYLKGLRIPYTDLLFLRLYKLLTKLIKNKLIKYKYLHIISDIIDFKCQNQIVHIDDPTYGLIEQNNLKIWNKYMIRNNYNSFIVCTNSVTAKWLNSFMKNTKTLIIEQGFFQTEIKQDKLGLIENRRFSCVYSSPYIHFNGDKHGNHETWGANLLIEEIIPKLLIKDPEIEIHLIGEIGKEAKKFLINFDRIIYHGRVDPYENMRILSACDIGIYPRKNDFQRSMLKIYSYIGAGLPIVTFDIHDSKVIEEYNLGLSVSNVKQFVNQIIFLKQNTKELQKLNLNVRKFRSKYSWEKLSKKMENYFDYN